MKPSRTPPSVIMEITQCITTQPSPDLPDLHTRKTINISQQPNTVWWSLTQFNYGGWLKLLVVDASCQFSSRNLFILFLRRNENAKYLLCCNVLGVYFLMQKGKDYILLIWHFREQFQGIGQSEMYKPDKNLFTAIFYAQFYELLLLESCAFLITWTLQMICFLLNRSKMSKDNYCLQIKFIAGSLNQMFF